MFSALAQSPVDLVYSCPAEDVDSFGLSCSADEPCPVFLELSSAESAGARMFVTGNLHTERTTLYGVLLQSEDGGKSWSEPLARIRAATLEEIEFLDLAHGWISGQVIEPLPRDPFFLITTDGGKSWRRKAIFDDSRFGSISQFWFDSPSSGEVVLDHSGKREVYATHSSGEGWELEQSTTQAVKLEGRRASDNLRLRADGKMFHLERRGDAAWEEVASFRIHVTDCK
jgi:photosystem II stability/assembly factor-like uncharacterized protein